jgi:hypothetical protein
MTRALYTVTRWVIRDRETGEDAGSVFACSRDCALAAAEVHMVRLAEHQGSEGVDDITTCDGGCDW